MVHNQSQTKTIDSEIHLRHLYHETSEATWWTCTHIQVPASGLWVVSEASLQSCWWGLVEHSTIRSLCIPEKVDYTLNISWIINTIRLRLFQRSFVFISNTWKKFSWFPDLIFCAYWMKEWEYRSSQLWRNVRFQIVYIILKKNTRCYIWKNREKTIWNSSYSNIDNGYPV